MSRCVRCGIGLENRFQRKFYTNSLQKQCRGVWFLQLQFVYGQSLIQMPNAYIRQYIALLNVTYCDDLLQFGSFGRCQHILYDQSNKRV